MAVLSDLTITGLPALLIILLILALLVAGAITLVRLTARGAKKVASSSDGDDARDHLS
jgi:hypothetical protein